MQAADKGGGVIIKRAAIVVWGYLGAVIGAGFASGQENVQFFVRYGENGLFGAFISLLLFSLCGALLMRLAHRHRVSNYQDLLVIMGGSAATRIIDLGLACFLFLGISTMFSASGALFHEHLHAPRNLGIATAYVTVLFALAGGKKGLVWSYNLLVPLKIVLLLVITAVAAFQSQQVEPGGMAAFVDPRIKMDWLLGAFLYVAYNFALAMVVLVEYQPLADSSTSIVGAACGGLLLGVLVIFMFLGLSRFMPVVLHYQIPMLYVAGMISPGTKLVYSLVLWMGIITTAIANAYGITQRVAHFIGIRYNLCLLCCLTLALPVATQSFSSLVGHIYPAFGVLGCSILALVLYWGGKDIIGEIYYNIKNLQHREC